MGKRSRFYHQPITLSRSFVSFFPTRVVGDWIRFILPMCSVLRGIYHVEIGNNYHHMLFSLKTSFICGGMIEMSGHAPITTSRIIIMTVLSFREVFLALCASEKCGLQLEKNFDGTTKETTGVPNQSHFTFLVRSSVHTKINGRLFFRSSLIDLAKKRTVNAAIYFTTRTQSFHQCHTPL